MSEGQDRAVLCCRMPEITAPLAEETAGGEKLYTGTVVYFYNAVDFAVGLTFFDNRVIAVTAIYPICAI